MADAVVFSGSVPQYYDRHLGPVLFDPYAADLVGRLPEGDGLRVLEVACGTGVATRRLREALPDTATLVATDLSEPMLEYAGEAVPLAGIEWRQADAQAMPFEDGSFDLVVCQFGLMFLPDKVQGFREMRRVLAAGGTLLANIWLSAAENPHAVAIGDTVSRLFPDDPPRFLDLPHGYCGAARIRADMAEAGWSDVRLEEVRRRGSGTTAADFATGFVFGSPLTNELVARDADLELVVRELTPALIQIGGDHPFEPPLGAIVIVATD